MPVWYEASKKWVESGRLTILGVIQEQHEDRCRLFAQWKRFDWPILHDPINVLELSAVPIVVAIDEHGIVRAVNPRVESFEADFLDKTYRDDAAAADVDAEAPLTPTRDFESIRTLPESARGLRSLGDSLALWGGDARLDDAVAAYSRAVALDPTDKHAIFRLGVAHRRRFDSDLRRPRDFQAAADRWSEALAIDPNQYIWRRRIEQYGPRLVKPYSFYDWVAQARLEIKERGEQPAPLAVEPAGTELSGPSKSFETAAITEAPPKSDDKVTRDTSGMILAEITVVPGKVRPRGVARVHITLTPDRSRKAKWNNESTPPIFRVQAPAGPRVSTARVELPQASAAESVETRRLDFEIEAPASSAGPIRLEAYLLYNVCSEDDGTCRYLRKDLIIEGPEVSTEVK